MVVELSVTDVDASRARKATRTGMSAFGSEADAHLGRRDVRLAPIGRHSQIRCWARRVCLFAIKNSLFQLQGIRPKKSRVSMGLCQRGGALQLNSLYFPTDQGISDSGDAFAVASQHSQSSRGLSGSLPTLTNRSRRSPEMRHEMVVILRNEI